MDLSALAIPGKTFAVRVTANARSSRIEMTDGVIRVWVTVIPEDGKANAAVMVLLAQALGVAKSRLTLIRGTMARDKVFRLD